MKTETENMDLYQESIRNTNAQNQTNANSGG